MKAGYLRKQGGKWRPVRLLDIVTLLHNVHAGSRHKEVGFEDALETLDSLTKKLSRKKFLIDPSILESALWSCNLMDENKEFWDAQGRTFDEFLKALLGSDKFDKFFNMIERKE